MKSHTQRFLFAGLATCGLAVSSALWGAVPAAAATTWWRPGMWNTMQIQFSGPLDLSTNASIFDLDGEGTTPATVAALKAKTRRVVCYFSAGSWEEWRGDAAAFPPSLRGKPLAGWPGENWLDIRQLDVLMPIMKARIQMCKDKGFDAVDPDNMDGYTQDSGFTMTPQHQLAYVRALSAAAHEAGLAFGMKNNVGQLAEVVNDADFAINESCQQYAECGLYAPFLKANKPVFHIAYQKDNFAATCASVPPGFRTFFKNRELDAWRKAC